MIEIWSPDHTDKVLSASLGIAPVDEAIQMEDTDKTKSVKTYADTAKTVHTYREVGSLTLIDSPAGPDKDQPIVIDEEEFPPLPISSTPTKAVSVRTPNR